MRRLYQFWNQHYRPLLLIVAFIALAIWLAVARQALAPPPTPTAYPTATPYPTYTPYPTATPVPFDYALLNAIYERIQTDDTIPALGKKPVISLIGGEPTFAFPDNAGLVLQYKLFQMPAEAETVDKITLMLIGTGVAVAGEQGISLDAIEVVFYVTQERPWVALVLTPPWRAEQLMLAPLDPEYIQKLKEQGVITPTLETY